MNIFLAVSDVRNAGLAHSAHRTHPGAVNALCAVWHQAREALEARNGWVDDEDDPKVSMYIEQLELED